LSQFTGGENYYYSNFRSDKDGEKLFHDVRNDILRETGMEAVFRVRTSKGLSVEHQYGNFFVRSTDLLAIPNVDADKSFGFQFQLTDNNVNTKYISFQAALLYTTSFGERRIRILTQCLPVSSSIADIFKSSDVGAVTALITKTAVEKALSSRLSDARDGLVSKCVDIMAVYKSDLASKKDNTQLLLPEALKLLPLYVLSLIKSSPFKVATDLRPDERTYYMNMMRILSINNIISFIYPTLYNLSNMSPEIGNSNEGGMVNLPPIVTLSSEHLIRNGLFLMEDSQQILLWFGRDYPSDALHQILGVTSFDNIDLNTAQLPSYDSVLSIQINNVVQGIRGQKSVFMPLRIIREGSPLEYLFTQRLVEDKSRNSTSYYDFLVHVHQRIIAKG